MQGWRLFSSQFLIDNPVTTLVHYPRKEVRLAFRETPLTTQIFHFWRLPCPLNFPLAVLRPPIRRTVPVCVLSPLPMAASAALRAAPATRIAARSTPKRKRNLKPLNRPVRIYLPFFSEITFPPAISAPPWAVSSPLSRRVTSSPKPLPPSPIWDRP